MRTPHSAPLAALLLALAIAGCTSSSPTGAPPTSAFPGGGGQAAGSGATPGNQVTAPDTAPDGGQTAVDPNLGASIDDPNGQPGAPDPLLDETDPAKLEQPVAPGLGSYAERAFVDGIIRELTGNLSLIEDASTKVHHAELKAYLAEVKPQFADQLTQLKAWRKAWFGSEAVVGATGVNLEMFPQDFDYDWSWADEMTRRMQSGLQLASNAASLNVRAEVKTMAQGMLKDWLSDRNQLNDWVDAWLQEAPPADDAYDGVDLGTGQP